MMLVVDFVIVWNDRLKRRTSGPLHGSTLWTIVGDNVGEQNSKNIILNVNSFKKFILIVNDSFAHDKEVWWFVLNSDFRAATTSIINLPFSLVPQLLERNWLCIFLFELDYTLFVQWKLKSEDILSFCPSLHHGATVNQGQEERHPWTWSYFSRWGKARLTIMQ
jgi:hypothetical protein